MKSSLISNRPFQLVLQLTTSADLSSGSGYLQNTAAFQALLCNLEVNIHIFLIFSRYCEYYLYFIVVLKLV